VVFRIVFSLYGPLHGLEKIPNLFIMLGLILLVVSLILTANEKDPVKFAEAAELFMKGFLVISMGISISGTYAAQAAAEYGFGAIESMVALWILFLPVSATLSFVCCTLKQKTAEGELWQQQGLFRKMPISGVAFFFAVCVIAGLPPFVGFPSKQFLYRSSSYITPLLTIFLLISALLMLLISIRYISKVMFGKPSENSENIRNDDVQVIVPLIILFAFLFYSTVTPSLFINSMVSPSVYSLLNRGQLVNAIHQGGASE
jgi:NADH:ubiquinone oxidoreductase subunit 5 (subunit L)/multisubunit Na+/H+ antiporter MnhA subunit